MKILIAEDNERLAENIRTILEAHAYVVDVVHDGIRAENRIKSNEYDIALVDIMMPRQDGIAVCQTIRTAENTTPIILITAKGALEDKITGLDAGANDYLIKPFEMEELLARIRAHTRVSPTNTTDTTKYTYKNITLYPIKHTVFYDEHEVSLTSKEFLILEYLIKKQNVTVTREQILNHCWDFAFETFSNIVDVNIKQLRKKLSHYGEHHIKTVHGIGYTME